MDDNDKTSSLMWPDLTLPPVSLIEDIRPALIRQEETIIFALIERSQYVLNSSCYLENEKSILSDRVKDAAKATPSPSFSFMDYFLFETEKFQAKLGRYNSSEEHAFFEPEWLKVASNASHKSRIKANNININAKIKHVYLNKILPTMCEDKEDADNYGSTCVCDVAVLQAISKRIHFGKFVAEAKFCAEREKFTTLIQNNDAQGLMEALTHAAVEEKVIERVRKKASHYGTDGSDSSSAYKVEPDVIAKLYKDYLIPLNKDVQVEYLLQRLDRPAYAFPDKKLHRKRNFDELNGKSEDSEGRWQQSREEEAGRLHFGEQSKGLPCVSIREVFRSVSTNKVPFGVVPMEHPSLGLNKATQIALVQSSLKVCACVCLPVEGADQPERYFIIGPIKPSLTSETSQAVLLFATKHEPGSLVKALSCLGEANLNLRCLESIPSLQNNEYMFYCEIDCSKAGFEETKRTLEKLSELTKDV
eukprot:CAMPEP_0204871986 /NCGR_PEP_ID=MMETSP1348-20121228/37000_1 /ASSEMBLY_ACC=CAM_ASM_000700 /TAXON_ID=215587 /ORGANISM="Aplanochytrium stocchinoi, Strain GSBS06" /LENGTH=474 /DNA_ID=CAMNT_0052026593 /DNA_START=6 /DNA_END=1426 /DNA_ORIENTATION=-